MMKTTDRCEEICFHILNSVIGWSNWDVNKGANEFFNNQSKYPYCPFLIPPVDPKKVKEDFNKIKKMVVGKGKKGKKSKKGGSGFSKGKDKI